MSGVKICGLSTPETLQTALDYKAEFVGFVFYEKSPRHVTLSQATNLVRQARNHAQTVALVVDAEDDQLLEITQSVQPDWFQLHGSETPERVRAIKSLTGKPVIKAIRLATNQDLTEIPAFAKLSDLLLFDAKLDASHLPGGNGVAFDWSLLEGQRGHRYMLSGGLTPENVGQALAVTAAPLVDVSSGVEMAPGQKDVALIRKFIEATRNSS